jgi:subtilase family serine protease
MTTSWKCKFHLLIGLVTYATKLIAPRSDPDSEKFGKHWTPEEVHHMFAPEEETVANIKEWLTNFGIHGARIVHSENKGWVAVDVTVQEAEELLQTEFYEHEHQSSSKVRVGCDKYGFLRVQLISSLIQTGITYQNTSPPTSTTLLLASSLLQLSSEQ